MNRLLTVAATLVATTLSVTTGSAQAPPTSVLAGKKFTPPMRGEVMVEFTAPVTKREKDLVVTRVQVKNIAAGPIARLTISETWYDKAGGVVGGGKGTINGLLQPGEIQTIVIETPYDAKMNGNNFNFSHVNGTVKPQKVAKFDMPPKQPAAQPAAGKKP